MILNKNKVYYIPCCKNNYPILNGYTQTKNIEKNEQETLFINY